MLLVLAALAPVCEVAPWHVLPVLVMVLFVVQNVVLVPIRLVVIYSMGRIPGANASDIGVATGGGARSGTDTNNISCGPVVELMLLLGGVQYVLLVTMLPVLMAVMPCRHTSADTAATGATDIGAALTQEMVYVSMFLLSIVVAS